MYTSLRIQASQALRGSQYPYILSFSPVNSRFILSIIPVYSRL